MFHNHCFFLYRILPDVYAYDVILQEWLAVSQHGTPMVYKCPFLPYSKVIYRPNKILQCIIKFCLQFVKWSHSSILLGKLPLIYTKYYHVCVLKHV